MKLSPVGICIAFCMIYFFHPQRGYTNIKDRNSFINSSGIFNAHFSTILPRTIMNTLFLFDPPKTPCQNENNHAQHGGASALHPGTTIALIHEMKEQDGAWGPKQPRWSYYSFGIPRQALPRCGAGSSRAPCCPKDYHRRQNGSSRYTKFHLKTPSAEGECVL